MLKHTQRYTGLPGHTIKPDITMRTSISRLLRPRTIWILFLSACNSDPVVPFKPQNPGVFIQKEIFMFPGSSIAIDLESVVGSPLESGSLAILEQPFSGSLQQLDPFFFKYTSEDFADGIDQFHFSAVLENNSRPASGIVRIIRMTNVSEFPCDIHPVQDFSYAARNKPTPIKPLVNDHICGVTSDLDVFIHLQPQFGNAVVSGDSIIYTPQVSFDGTDELVYGVSVAGSDEVLYGIISFDQNETLAISPGFKDIFFVSDSVGFISGGTMLFKTNDGGRHWKELVYPRGGYEALDIEEIFFLDLNIGFAAFSKCAYNDEPECRGGLLMTNDGGVSWKRVDFDHPVTSVFFTSPSTGYLSFKNIFTNDGWDPIIYFSIMKTIDGGETWKDIASKGALSGELKIRFVNDDLGYAFQADNIYGTTDAGITWTESTSDGYVGSIVSAENIAFASLNSTYSYLTPSMIVRSINGAEWTPVATFQYSILAHDFSPSGSLGVAVGSPGMGSMPTLAISRTVDKGDNWNTVTGNFNGFPRAISVPSENVAYILCADKVITFSP
jgi:photosystem II stability/assembly factor-like uncharacterized protein